MHRSRDCVRIVEASAAAAMTRLPLNRTGPDAVPPRPADESTSLGALTGMIGFHLRLAQEASFRAFSQRVGEADLKPRRFAMLMLINENSGLTQTALSRASGRDKSTITPAIDDLERRGLVERRRCPTDRRAHGLHLTAAGKGLLEELLRHARSHDDELDRIVGLENKAEFIRILRRIAMALG